MAVATLDGADRTAPEAEEARHAVQQAPIALAAAVLGFFVVTFDAVVVNVALPAVRHDLGGGMTGLQWIVDGYTLMFAALLLWAGALTDRVVGRSASGWRRSSPPRRAAASPRIWAH